MWYRAQVISVLSEDPLEVRVVYVDYGTSEVIQSDRFVPSRSLFCFFNNNCCSRFQALRCVRWTRGEAGLGAREGISARPPNTNKYSLAAIRSLFLIGSLCVAAIRSFFSARFPMCSSHQKPLLLASLCVASIRSLIFDAFPICSSFQKLVQPIVLVLGLLFTLFSLLF